MQVGDIVRHKLTDRYGTVAYSTFGLSIHFYYDGFFHKSLGRPVEQLQKFWEVCPMPEGYKIGLYGGLIKDEGN